MPDNSAISVGKALAAIWEIDALTGRARVFASGGYKVIFIPFADGRPSGTPIDVLIGFVREEEDEAMGRPVGVVIDRMGALLVADDVGNVVWRVAAAAPGSR